MTVFERSNIVTENCVHCDRPYSHHNIDGKCLNHPGDIATECYATRKTTVSCGSFHAYLSDGLCKSCGWHLDEHEADPQIGGFRKPTGRRREMSFFREAEAKGSCKHCGEVRWSHDPDTAECPPLELRTAAAINPKDALGTAKVPLSLVPPVAIIHAAEAFRDGLEKHGGPYNWRENKVKASDCVDAAMRHILSWFDGEELAQDSGVHHLGNAIARLAIILDAYEVGALVDDRPPPGRAADLLDSLHREREAEEKAAEHDRDLELADEIPF